MRRLKPVPLGLSCSTAEQAVQPAPASAAIAFMNGTSVTSAVVPSATVRTKPANPELQTVSGASEFMLQTLTYPDLR
jgi:hypothetical protein